MDRWLQWAAGYEGLLVGLGISSLVMFVGTLLLVPVLVVRMPADYFLYPERSVEPSSAPAVWRALARVGKNLLGLVLLLVGLALLVLPGQGVLTIVIALALFDFPGKRRLQRALARRSTVRRSVDWIRGRRGQPPLRFIEDERPGPDHSSG
jgi:hypothetical protein